MKGNGRTKTSGRNALWAVALVLASVPAALAAQNCQKIVLEGEASAGQEWRSSFGQGWVFRVVPIQPGWQGYSGWDLVVDREQPTGFPDALLLATPPYNSINEHEVGTTYGLRAQDAIGWNPRSFRFLANPEAFRESQGIYMQLSGSGKLGAGNTNSTERRLTQRLITLEQQSSAGQFRILDARLAPGVADAAQYAENWALNSTRVPHSIVATRGGGSSPRGELQWMHFSIALWLPAEWKTPRQLHAERVACAE